ncbi:MXAN_6640 family putative metalloprotease [Nocardioides yefusunii]|uniref:MXAN_6640 family putative metalloprotease n=1 Tax=Nocardioides yefusunii TaxID=2500546 RepID=A0ABW1QXW9_9ACTN|nr:MXAN_6640 family putative metalloprotease [Nocardioides yefusunii]
MTRAVNRPPRGARTPRRTLIGVAAALALSTLAVLPAPPFAATPAAAEPAWASTAHDYGVGVATASTCSAKICVHRALSGPDAASAAWAEKTLRHADTAWRTLVDGHGYRAPAASPSSDGDERFDVYLADLAPQGQYGRAMSGDDVPGQTRRSRSYLVIENDMAGMGRHAAADLAATVAHEFFHAVQLNIDDAEDTWFMEASATWAETQVFPHLPRNRQYLMHGQVGRRGLPLDSPSGAYGNHVFVERLAAVAGRDAVRQVWNRLDASTGSRDENPLQAVAAVLAARDMTWRDFYTGFAVANLTPGRSYPAHVGGTMQRPDTTVKLGPRRRSTAQTARLPHLTSRVTAYKVASSAKKRRLRITITSTDPERTGAMVLVERKDGSLRRVPARLSASGRATVTVLAKRKRVKRVLVVTTNTSRAFRDCGNDSGWTCGGMPVHDRTKVTVSAKLR